MKKIKSRLFQINGDLKLSFYKKIIYIFFSLFEILRENKCIKNSVKIKYKNLKKFLYFYKKLKKNIIKDNSPTRIICDYNTFFFLIKNFNKNKKIKILDIGCGNGQYIVFFKNFFKNIQYVGIDIKESDNWKKYRLKKNITFIKSNLGKKNNLKKIKNKFKSFDLIFSQSVFEHVKNDLFLFNEVFSIFPASKHLHYVPGAISFFNYLFHGFRRYYFSELKKISELNKNIKIIPLGGKFALRAYYLFYKRQLNKRHIFNFFDLDLHFKNDNEFYRNIFQIRKKEFPVFYSIQKK